MTDTRSATKPDTHTPGPWHVTEDGFVVGADGRRAGYMHGNPLDVFAEAARVHADRRLIASAPDMLAALMKLARAHKEVMHEDSYDYADIMQDHPGWEAVRAAIARATGAAQ